MLAVDLGGPPGEQVLSPLGRDELTGLHRLPWQFVRLTGVGRQLIVSVSLGGGCTIKGVTLDETNQAVHVTIYGRCAQGRAVVLVRRHALAVVQLAAPLGQRQLTGGQDRPDVGNRPLHGFDPEA
jgi:hypothetical protein